MAQEDTANFALGIEMDGQMTYFDNSDVLECYFIEDIFSFSVVGRVKVLDRYGIFELGQLTGREKMEIIYGEESQKSREFIIYKIGRIQDTTAGNIYTGNKIDITFVDQTFPKLTEKRYSYSWQKEKVHEIIKQISKKMLEIEEFEEFEEAKEKMDFCMPYWTPAEAIKFLLKRCSSKEHDRPGFLYFNNLNGTNFITLEKLFQNSKKDENVYVFQDVNLFYLNKILSWNLLGSDSIGLKDISGSNRLGYDPIKKKLLFNEYNYSDAIKKFTMLGKKTLFNDDIKSETIRYKYDAETDPKVIDNIYYSDFIKTYSSQQALTLHCRGYEERFAGQMIDIEWPSSIESEKFSKPYAGKYLIKSVISMWNFRKKPNFMQKLICLKNAYESSDDDYETAGKTNLDSFSLGSS